MRSDRHLYDPERGREEKIKKKKKKRIAQRKRQREQNHRCATRILFTWRDYIVIYTCFHLKPYNITIARFYLKKKRKKKKGGEFTSEIDKITERVSVYCTSRVECKKKKYTIARGGGKRGIIINGKRITIEMNYCN